LITALLLFMAALGVDPVAAPVQPVEAQMSPPTIADSDIREYAAIAGRKVAGRPVGGPYPNADKLLLLARDGRGSPAIAASIGFPVRQSLPPPPKGTIAIVRLHQRSETTVPGPTADDIAFVAANRLPLFVIGEWTRPAPMWEVAWIDDAVRYRAIGEVGEIGPWQD